MTVRYTLRAALVAAGIATVIPPSYAETSKTEDLPALSSLAGSYLAGRSANTARDLRAAAAFFTAALANDPDNSILMDRVLLLSIANGEIDKALEHAEKLIKIDPRNPMARFVRGVDAIERGDLAAAETEVSSTALGPLTALAGGLLGAWAVFGSGDTDKALDMIADLTGPSWYGIFKDYHTALIADLAGREDLAVSSIASAAAADGTVLQLIVANARILARAGQRQEALESIRDYLVIQPNNVSLIELEKTLESDTDIAPVVASTIEGAAEVLQGLGGMIGTDNGVELSAAYLQLALRLTPESDMTRLSLGQVLVAAERCEDAITVFGLIPAVSEHRRNADIQSGFCLDLLDRPDEAIDRLKVLLESDPADLDVVVALGNVLSGRERYEEAAEVYTAGIDTIDEVTPGHWRLFYRRGIAYERSKQWPKAEADLKKALELNPDQPSVLNYLGYSWVDMGRNLDEGLDMIRSAADQRPNDGYIVDSLGWAYYRLGRYEEAVAQLERAVELRPEDPVLNDHLGDAYWQVGRRLEAIFQWSHARDLDPEPENLEMIVKKLETGLVADGGNDG